MSLVARVLEEGGIPTVILGSALDIVEHCGVPRFLFVDFPLGNPCGKPWDREMQAAIADLALDLFGEADQPRTTIRAPFPWDTQTWRDAYMALKPGDKERLRQKGAEMRKRRATLRANKSAQSS